MKFEIKHRFSGDVIFSIETTSMKMAVGLAIEAGADLRGADLRGADLRGADLRGADLTDADLTGADLRGADLRGADLRGADLRGADLTDADLTGAVLTGAVLRGADLRGAVLDFSSGFSFRCGSFGIKADLRLAAQLAYHFCRFDFGECAEAKEAQRSLQDLANKFHRVDECGRIKIA